MPTPFDSPIRTISPGEFILESARSTAHIGQQVIQSRVADLRQREIELERKQAEAEATRMQTLAKTFRSFSDKLAGTNDPLDRMRLFKEVPLELWADKDARDALTGLLGAFKQQFELQQKIDEVTGQAELDKLRVKLQNEFGLPRVLQDGSQPVIGSKEWVTAVGQYNLSLLDQMAQDQGLTQFPRTGEFKVRTSPATGVLDETDAMRIIRGISPGRISSITSGPGGAQVTRVFPDSLEDQIDFLGEVIQGESDPDRIKSFQRKQSQLKFRQSNAEKFREMTRSARNRAYQSGLEAIAKRAVEEELEPSEVKGLVDSLRDAFIDADEETPSTVTPGNKNTDDAAAGRQDPGGIYRLLNHFNGAAPSGARGGTTPTQIPSNP